VARYFLENSMKNQSTPIDPYLLIKENSNKWDAGFLAYMLLLKMSEKCKLIGTNSPTSVSISRNQFSSWLLEHCNPSSPTEISKELDFYLEKFQENLKRILRVDHQKTYSEIIGCYLLKEVAIIF
jgi:hypothetical protein